MGVCAFAGLWGSVGAFGPVWTSGIAERAWNGGPEGVRVPYAKCCFVRMDWIPE